MPVGHPPIRAHPGKPLRTIRDAAADGQVIELRCSLCRRRVTFLAHDLLRVCNPDHPVHIPLFGCTRCRTIEHVSVNSRYPQKEEYGRLPIRRPVQQVWKWRMGLLGEDGK